MYAKVIDGEVIKYPYTLQELYEDNPNVGFPSNLTDEILSRFGAARVVVTGAPTHNTMTQKVVEATPVYSVERSRWEQAWQIVDKTADEIEADRQAAAAAVRAERNAIIAAYDWTQLPDSPVDQSAWAAYRQELRDVPEQPGFPWNVVWPARP